MDINEFLIKWPIYRLATAADNSEILAFCAQNGSSGEKYSFKYQRGPDFFRFNQLQSDISYTFLAFLENNIVGIFSLLIRPSYILGAEKSICYFSDLIIARGYSNKIKWDYFASDLMKQAGH